MTKQAAEDEHFMRAALDEARLALREGEFPVGCVLVEYGTIIARGRRCNSKAGMSNEVDHAEVMTLRNLLVSRPGMDCSRVTAYSTMEPCLMCYTTMLLSGIRRFVWSYEDVMGGGTALALDSLPPLYRAMKVKLVPAVLRSESLALFACFFEQFSYWQGSLLAEYTLEQMKRIAHVQS